MNILPNHCKTSKPKIEVKMMSKKFNTTENVSSGSLSGVSNVKVKHEINIRVIIELSNLELETRILVLVLIVTKKGWSKTYF